MANKTSITDEIEDDTTVFVRVFINKQYELTENINTSQDIWKLAELDKSQIDMESLREDIPQAFRKAKWIKPLFKNKKQYTWKIFTYDTSKADIEIESDDDLQEEINEYISDTEDSDQNAAHTEDKYLKLRVVFFTSMSHNNNKTNNNNGNNNTNNNNNESISPQLIISEDIKQNNDMTVIEKEPLSQIKSWNEFPNFLQVLGVNCDAIKIIFTLKKVVIKNTKYTINNVSENDQKMATITVEKNNNVVIKDNITAEPNKVYNLAVFLDESQVSNTVNIQTQTQNFIVNNTYIPYSPFKKDIRLFYDEKKEFILMIWNVPKLTFGDSIIYKIKLSNKLQCDKIIKLPYKM
eukprot:397683_1